MGEGGGGERFGCAGGGVCSGAAVMEEERATVCIHSWQISGYCGEQRKGMSSDDNDSKLMAIADLRLGMYSNGSGWLGMWALPVVTTTRAGMLQCRAIRLGGRGGVFTRRTF